MVFAVAFVNGSAQHDISVVICMRRVNTKLSPRVSTDLFHLTGTHHVTASILGDLRELILGHQYKGARVVLP